jgi:[FeFe] hydrogenase H-cluster maturation GTPase HydF
MSLNGTPSAERVHIGIFGRRNAGKSSLINAMTGQSLSIVSDIEGTTTDPVQKAMELLPLGPVVMIDTPGIDDEGTLGTLRVGKSYQMLNKSDIALLILDAREGMTQEDCALLKKIRKKEIACLVVLNQADRLGEEENRRILLAVKTQISEIYDVEEKKPQVISVSAATGYHIQELKEMIAMIVPDEQQGRRIVADLLKPGELVVLVVPIDKAAPKGRLILPQQQTIRDILEAGAQALVVRDTELEGTIRMFREKIRLVITDSQAFEQVAKIVPDDMPLTSFSILFARYKGELEPLLAGTRALGTLKDGDKILISEGCTHHRQCDDIGTVKMPNWITKATGKKLKFEFTSGGGFPENITDYALIVHCGGCMLNAREMRWRIACAADAGVPITNYGMIIAYMKGIIERSMSPVR